MSDVNNAIPDKLLVRAAFETAASDYDATAVLQQEVAARLIERLQYIKHQPEKVLDLGCGTGQCLAGLHKQYPAARIVAMDIAHNMLRHARNKQGFFDKIKKTFSYVSGDAEQLPLVDNSIDVLISNLAFQWSGDLEKTFAECQRVLKPGGLLMFTTLGPDTLKELRQCWSEVDGYSHVNRFIDMHDIGDMLMNARFSEPVMDMEMISMTYQDAATIMRELKTIGAHNVTRGRSRSLTGKGRLQKVIARYEQFRHEGVLPVSYEVIYGHAWITEQKQSTTSVKVSMPGTTNV